ncbi:MAG: hypothetical protein ACLFUQ_04865 [Candidatus Izemoplasmataceae bacterium]
MLKRRFQLALSVLFIFTLMACGEDGTFDVAIEMDEPVEGISFEQGDDVFESQLSDSTYTVQGVTIGDTLTLVHESYSFEPEVLTIETVGQDFSITATALEDDTDDASGEEDSDQDGSNNDSDDGADDVVDDNGDDDSDDLPDDDSSDGSDDDSDDGSNDDSSDGSDDDAGDGSDDDADDGSDDDAGDGSDDDAGDGSDDDSDQDDSDDESDQDDESESNETIDVDNADEFESAIQDAATDTIVLHDSLDGDFVIESILSIDFNDNGISGDLTFETDEDGTIELLDGGLNGALTIDAKNASLDNHLSVSQAIEILALASNSYHDYSESNFVKLVGDRITATFYNGAEGVFIEGDGIHLIAEDGGPINAINIFDDAEDATFTHSENIAYAYVGNASAHFDALPMGLGGPVLPSFDGTIIESIETSVEETFTSNAGIDDIESTLPETVSVMTEDGSVDVEVGWDVDGLDIDPEADGEQSFFVAGMFMDLDTDDLINANFLQPFAEITIEAPVPETIPLIDTVLADDSIETSLDDVESLDEVKALLPSNILALHVGGSIDVDVEWTLDEGTFDDASDETETLEFVGQLSDIPEGYSDPDSLAPTITMTIEPAEVMVSDDPFYVGSNYPEGIDIELSTDDFTEDRRIDVSIELDQEFHLSHYEDYYTGEVYEADVKNPRDHVFSEFFTGETFHLKAVLFPVERPDTETLYGGGSGTEADPFLIEDTTQLSNMRYYLDRGYHFKLANDIHFDEDETFTPMRSENDYPFDGVLDGDGHTIHDYAIEIEAFEHPNEDQSAHVAFIMVNEGTIKNLNFSGLDVSYERPSSDDPAYSFAGPDAPLVEHNYGLIENITVDGSVENVNAGLVDRNHGTIREVDVDLTMINTSAGIVAGNRNLVEDVTATIDLTQTRGTLSGLGGIASTSFSEDREAIIRNADVTFNLNYDVEDDDSGRIRWGIGGIAARQSGEVIDGTIYNALIENSTANVQIVNDGDHAVSSIGGVVSRNTQNGIIRNSQAFGEIHGGRDLGGFVYYNGWTSKITNSEAHVDVYGEGLNIGGFAATNDSSWEREGEITHSTATGDVYAGDFPRSSFIATQDGYVDDNSNSGDTFDYPE